MFFKLLKKHSMSHIAAEKEYRFKHFLGLNVPI